LICAAENGFMGMGIGAAMTGLRPIVEGMNMGFLLLAFNQISNNCGMLHYTSGGQFKVLPVLVLLLMSCVFVAASC
jgi:pyruvate dehydrogenase E1 component beta subunit